MEIVWAILIIIAIVKLVELIIKNMGIILVCGSVILTVWLIRAARTEKQRAEEKFLRELYQGSAVLIETVAYRIMDALEKNPYTQEVKCFIHWKILNTELNQCRVLVRPKNRNEFTALVGKDPYNKRPFIYILPPDIHTTQAAMAWIYNFPNWNPEMEA